MQFIHVTSDIAQFEDGLLPTSPDRLDSFRGEGLFVHRYHSEFPVKRLMQEWDRWSAIIVECDESIVDLIQRDPLGDDPDRDEYMIQRSRFAEAKIVDRM